MDNSYPLILEISSDEESGFVDARERDFTGDGDGFGDREDHDWLSKLLVEVDGDKDDDSDEVLLVSEVIPNPKKPRLQSSKPAWEIVCGGGDENDDDCVILDCEPDQARVVKNDVVDNNLGGGDDDSDDLEIVGEKGEVMNSSLQIMIWLNAGVVCLFHCFTYSSFLISVWIFFRCLCCTIIYIW